MLRSGFGRLLSRCHDLSFRAIATTRLAFQEGEGEVAVGKEEFIKSWDERVASGLKTPNFASDWTEPKETEAQEEAKPTELPKKLRLNFYMPSEIIMEQTEVYG